MKRLTEHTSIPEQTTGGDCTWAHWEFTHCQVMVAPIGVENPESHKKVQESVVHETSVALSMGAIVGHCATADHSPAIARMKVTSFIFVLV